MAGSEYYINQSGCNDQEKRFLRHDDAVVKPVKGKRSLSAESPIVMVGTSGDLEKLIRLMPSKSARPQPIFISRSYTITHDSPSAVLVGPIVGAPYAVMVLETLIAWGARQFFYFGWCGAISPEVRIGDLVVPTAAIIDEGTSCHYPCTFPSSKVSEPTLISVDQIRQRAQQANITFHEAAVWTTDAIFRETPEKIRHFSSQGAMVVDMETSALFTVAKYRDVKIGCLLVVSDELSSLNWVPGFKTSDFSCGRDRACEVMRRLCLSRPIPT